MSLSKDVRGFIFYCHCDNPENDCAKNLHALVKIFLILNLFGSLSYVSGLGFRV